jgi:hypothetical protein
MISRGLRTRIVLYAVVLIASSLITMRTQSVSAYSGLQVPRDESDSCCVIKHYGGPGVWQTDSSPNGYDSNAAYAPPAQGHYITYYPYPNPSPTQMCPVFHVPNVSEASNFLSFTGYHPSYGTAESNGVNETYAHNYWVSIPQGSYYSSDYVYTSDNSDQPYSGDWAVDVVEFHYNTDHVSCSY